MGVGSVAKCGYMFGIYLVVVIFFVEVVDCQVSGLEPQNKPEACPARDVT